MKVYFDEGRGSSALDCKLFFRNLTLLKQGGRCIASCARNSLELVEQAKRLSQLSSKRLQHGTVLHCQLWLQNWGDKRRAGNTIDSKSADR